jgi:hypothetical protein
MPLAEKPIMCVENILADSVVTASSTLAGTDAKNLSDWRDYTFWASDAGGTQTVTIDRGAVKPADIFVVYGHNLFTASGEIAIETSPDGLVWTIVQASGPIVSDTVLYGLFTSVSSQFWRASITGLTTSVSISHLFIGERFYFERYLSEGYDPNGEAPVGENLVGDSGQLLGSTRTHVDITLTATFRNVSSFWFIQRFKRIWDRYLCLRGS